MVKFTWGRRLSRQVGMLLCAIAFTAGGLYPELRMAKRDCAMQTATLVKDPSCRGMQSTDDIETFQAPMDRTSYLQYARSILGNHDFRYWGANIWPPAFPLLVAAELKLLGTDLKDSRYQLHMACVAAVLWAAAFWLWFNALLPLGLWRFASGLVFLLPTFREWTLAGGALTSESLSLALLFSTLGMLLLALQRRRLGLFVAAALFIAASGYARGVLSAIWEGVLLGLLVCCGLYGAIRFLAESARHSGVPLGGWAMTFMRRELRRPYSRAIGVVTLMLVTVEAGLFPWKHHMAAQGTYQMTASAKFEIEAYMWSPSLPGFVVTGNTPCVVDPALCKAIVLSPELSTYPNKKRLALATFLNRPGPWIHRKVLALDQLWFGASIRSTDPWEVAENVGYPVLYLLGMSMLAFRARRSRACTLALLTGGFFLLGNAAVFTMMHFEYRYGLPLKLFAFCLPWAAWALSRLHEPLPAVTPT